MNNEEIRKTLFDLRDVKYRDFSSKLTPGEENMIGVRVPLVKELARQIARNDPEEYLRAPYSGYHEECLLHGLVIGYLKADIDKILTYLDAWLPCVTNWAVCDSSVMNMKALGKPANKQKVWDYLIRKLDSSTAPYTIRAIVVAMFAYFNDPEYVHRVADVYQRIRSDHYYVNMALAWGMSVILVKNYTVALEVLKKQTLDKWVQNKSIQKAVESFRLTDEQKQELRTLKL